VITMRSQVARELTLEDVQRALTENLGPGYRVTASSASALRVYRNPVIWATVHLTWPAGETAFRVRPGGFLLVMLLNASYTVPKVRRALQQSFGEAEAR
jgi:hypothetical protein